MVFEQILYVIFFFSSGFLLFLLWILIGNLIFFCLMLFVCFCCFCCRLYHLSMSGFAAFCFPKLLSYRIHRLNVQMFICNMSKNWVWGEMTVLDGLRKLCKGVLWGHNGSCSTIETVHRNRTVNNMRFKLRLASVFKNQLFDLWPILLEGTAKVEGIDTSVNTDSVWGGCWSWCLLLAYCR